jgi:hypothetical protein
VDTPDFEKGWLAFVDPAMTDDRWIAPTRLARALTLLAALAFVVSYVCIALLRIDYPFEIEWMEGGSRGHVARILSGEALYGPPTLAFTPFIYTPLYFQVTAWLVPVFAEGFLALRFVSWFASLGCFALVAAFVLGETRNRVAALLAMGVFAATYRISGAWFDIARVDRCSCYSRWQLCSRCDSAAGGTLECSRERWRHARSSRSKRRCRSSARSR